MKNQKAYKVLLLSFLALSFTNFQCDKEAATAFCQTNRSLYKTVNNEEGTIVYLDKYDRYAINFKVDIPNNIDTQITGLLCDPDPGFRKIGLVVNVSGILKNFSSNEDIRPETGGQELYFFEPSQIAIK